MRKFIRSIFVCGRRSDTILSLAIYGLLIFGIVVTSSAGISTNSTVKGTVLALAKSILVVVGSVVVYHLVSNYFRMEKMTIGLMYLLTGIEIALLIGAFVWCRFIYKPLNGSYAWFHSEHLPMSFQPSELAKIVTILMIAVFYCDKRFKDFSPFSRIVMRPIFIILVMVGIVAALQKDIGTALIISMIAVLVFLLPSNRVLIPWQVFAVLAMVAVVFAYVFLLGDSGQQFLKDIGLAHVAARFKAVFNPSYTSDETREIFYSLLGISKGSIFGVGLGESVQKFGYLVSAEADYIFAIIAEELGLLGITIVFTGYFIIIWRLLRFSRKVTTEADKAILFGTACYLFVHFFMNIGGVSGLIPLTGVPLLLISHGGSAMISIMACLGMCQGVIDKYQKSRDDRRKLIA